MKNSFEVALAALDRNTFDSGAVAALRLCQRIDEIVAQRDELAVALRDAEFLLRQISINWKEAGSMKDSCARSAEDARAAIAKLEKEKEGE